MVKRLNLEICCEYCKAIFITKERTRKLCSVACKNKQQSINFKGRKQEPKFGAENPNFGKKWSDEKRKAQSELIKSKVDAEYREKCSTANRGVKFSQERISKMHDHRTSESYSRPHTDETKQILSKKSKEKFTRPGYTEKIRNVMEERGHWIPENLKPDWEIYLKEANWKYRMFDILYEANSIIIKEFGVYNSFKNTTGVVRDHMLSRHTGFINGVFPELIRHIENCSIILHSDNIRKRHTVKDSIPIKDLFTRIENTNYTWNEQQICLELIKEYRNGKRWKRKEVK